MKYSNRFHKMLPDEFTRGMIYKQESRNALFAKKLINIDKKSENTAMIMESNFKKIYQLLTIILLIQSLQFVQYNYVYISVIRNEYYTQLTHWTTTIFSHAAFVFNYGYTRYLEIGNMFSFV